MNAFNHLYIRAIEKSLIGESVNGEHTFEVDKFGPRNNQIEYFYFVDGNGDLVEPTGTATVDVTISSGGDIFQTIFDATFLATDATDPDRTKPNGYGRAEKVKIAFTGTVIGAVGFRALFTQNVS